MIDYSIFIGKRFGRLVVTGIAGKDKSNVNVMLKCICDCGKEKNILYGSLKSGRTRSCGCLHREQLGNIRRTHGLKGYRLFEIWEAMIYRCTNEKSSAYHYYGERGIEVCNEWKNDFREFEKWSLDNGYDEELTLDRIDVNGGYNPKNCRWITRKEQMRNTRRNVVFEGKCISEWSEITGVPYSTLLHRVKIGMPVEMALQKTQFHRYWKKNENCD